MPTLGPHPTSYDNENIAPTLMWISSILMLFVILTTFLRLMVRSANHHLGWDDYTLLASVIISMARFAVIIKQVQYGYGRHRDQLSTHAYLMSNMYGWWAQVFLFPAIALLKVSICLLILRIKETRAMKWLLGCIGFLILVTNFGVVLLLLAECRPMGFWRGSAAKCWPTRIRIYSIYATIAYSVFTDFILSLLPLAIVWRVRIPFRTKISVAGLMSLGLLATGFGIARASSLGIQTADLTWSYSIAAIWSNIELFLGIIAANMALSRAVYMFFLRVSPPSSQSTLQVPSRSFVKGGSGAKNLGSDPYQFTETVIECSADSSEPTSTLSGSNIENKDEDVRRDPRVGIHKKTEFWVVEEDRGGKQ